MICESYLSLQRGLISETEFTEVEQVINSYFDKIDIEPQMIGSILEEMKNDKKNEDGKLNFTLIDGIGSCKIDCFVEDEIVEKCLNFYLTKRI